MHTKIHVRMLLVAAFALTLAACAKRVEFPVSSSVPAAIAKAKLSTDDNGNTEIRLRVQHLAPPERLSPPRAVYVAWIQLPTNYAINVGTLRVDDDFAGELRTLTPYKEFRLLVTAEDIPEVAMPGGQLILSTEILHAR